MSLDAAAKLDQISRQRAALEQLLLLAHQLSRMQGGIGLLQQMLKPSQAPGRKLSAIEQLGAQLQRQSSPQLQQQLTELDRSIAREISSVVVLSRLTRAEFIQRYCESKGAADAVALLEQQLNDFRRNGQLNVAIRYVLHGRGVQIKAAELPISQEAVAQRVEALRGEEQLCRQQLTDQARDLLTAIDGELADAATPADIQAQHRSARRVLTQTLKLLEAGRSLEELPLRLDSAVISLADDLPDESTKPQHAPQPALKPASQRQPSQRQIQNAVKSAPDKSKKAPRSFWRKLRLWLDTPWQTRWKDIE
jgi:hypothetical protein